MTAVRNLHKYSKRTMFIGQYAGSNGQQCFQWFTRLFSQARNVPFFGNVVYINWYYLSILIARIIYAFFIYIDNCRREDDLNVQSCTLSWAYQSRGPLFAFQAARAFSLVCGGRLRKKAFTMGLWDSEAVAYPVRRMSRKKGRKNSTQRLSGYIYIYIYIYKFSKHVQIIVTSCIF